MPQQNKISFANAKTDADFEEFTNAHEAVRVMLEGVKRLLENSNREEAELYVIGIEYVWSRYNKAFSNVLFDIETPIINPLHNEVTL